MFKFRKIASVLASAVMVTSTVALAAAANYPAPFVKSGSADVAVVYGSAQVGGSDLLAAADISTNLQTELAKQTASSSGASSGTTVSGGDYVSLDKSSDHLNLGNSASDVFGTSVDHDNLNTLLADGTYLNDKNSEYNYEQRITLGPNFNETFFADSDYANKEPTVGVQINSNKFVMNYTLDLTTDAQSDVSSGDLADFETTTLNLLGKEYYISEATNGTNANYFGKFTLLDTANSAVVKEGETKAVTVGDKTYNANIESISGSASSPKVKLSINGEVTNSLAEGETYKLSNGLYVGIKDISIRDVAGTVGTVEFSLGTGKIEVDNGADISFNDDSISGLKGWIVRGTPTGNKQTMDKIIIQWITDDEAFITNSSSLIMPGFQAVKFSGSSFFTPANELTTVNYDGDDSIELEAPIKDGTAKFNLLFANSTGEFVGLGKAADQVLKTSSTNGITFNQTGASNNVDQWFVVSYNDSSSSESYLLSAKIAESDSKNRTTIKNEITGQDICKDKVSGDSCNIGSASLTVGTVFKTGSDKWANFTAGSGTSFNALYTKTGLKIALPVQTTDATGVGNTTDGIAFFGDGNSNWSAGSNNDRFTLFFTEENKDGDIATGNKFNVTINDDSDGDLQVSDIDSGYTELDVVGSSDDTITMVRSDLATTLQRSVAGSSNSKGSAVITYHGDESYGQLFLTDLSSSVNSGSSSDGSVKSLGQVIVMDTEAASVDSKNLIVVGGSCVNTVAASLLGSSGSLCGADFTASTGVASGQFLIQTFSRTGGKVATLVAGYNAGDTTNAAKYLITQSVDSSVGMKYLGTSSTEATVQATSA